MSSTKGVVEHPPEFKQLSTIFKTKTNIDWKHKLYIKLHITFEPEPLHSNK